MRRGRSGRVAGTEGFGGAGRDHDRRYCYVGIRWRSVIERRSGAVVNREGGGGGRRGEVGVALDGWIQGSGLGWLAWMTITEREPQAAEDVAEAEFNSR